MLINIKYVLDGCGKAEFDSDGPGIPWNTSTIKRNFINGKQKKVARVDRIMNAWLIDCVLCWCIIALQLWLLHRGCFSEWIYFENMQSFGDQPPPNISAVSETWWGNHECNRIALTKMLYAAEKNRQRNIKETVTSYMWKRHCNNKLQAVYSLKEYL